MFLSLIFAIAFNCAINIVSSIGLTRNASAPAFKAFSRNFRSSSKSVINSIGVVCRAFSLFIIRLIFKLSILLMDTSIRMTSGSWIFASFKPCNPFKATSTSVPGSASETIFAKFVELVKLSPIIKIFSFLPSTYNPPIISELIQYSNGCVHNGP